jgi:hypothetical protein
MFNLVGVGIGVGIGFLFSVIGFFPPYILFILFRAV